MPAEVVATVMVLKALASLSDREAISALRRDIAWKVACGLRLDDEGFHPIVLVYWRNRIRTSPRPQRILQAVRQVVEQGGGLSGSTGGCWTPPSWRTRSPPGHCHPADRRDPSGPPAGGLRPARREHDHPRGWRHSRVR